MPLRRRSVLRIRTFAFFGLTYGVVGLLWEYIELGSFSAEGPIVGAVVGLTLAGLEETRIGRITHSMPFSKAVVVKSALYLAVLAIPVLITGFVGGFLDGLEISEFVSWMTSAKFLATLVIIYLIHLVVSFARHLNRLLGPRTLLRYLRGTYHRPRIEQRVFMFLDMRSSTSVAEALGNQKYFSLLNTFFRDISEPILEREAEIYQYVGDEVVLTWPAVVGFREANCIRVFFEILAELEYRRDYYEEEFGQLPEFKAGLHFGDVVTAEIGDLKKEIVYNGDVLNTTARIESMCNNYDQQLIASEELVSHLELPSFVDAIPLGPVVLRGKSDATSLIGLYSR